MNLLLIEKSLEKVANYLLPNTDNIVFDQTQSYDDLLSLIEQNKTYDNVGIFSHGNKSSFEFVQTIFSGYENTQFTEFLKQLETKTLLVNLDIFACYFGNNNNFITDLENNFSFNVRASTDDTGNTPFGNWIMETDNINIKNIYFNDDISGFKKTLWTSRTNFYSTEPIGSSENNPITGPTGPVGKNYTVEIDYLKHKGPTGPVGPSEEVILCGQFNNDRIIEYYLSENIKIWIPYSGNIKI